MPHAIANLQHPESQVQRDFAEISIALVAGIAFAVTALFIVTVPIAGNLAASRDFVCYWATGRQLVNHGDPYDTSAIASLEHAAGLNSHATLIMRNPPWALPLAYPLGFLGLRLAAILWTFILLGCLLLSVRMLRQLHGNPTNRIHWLVLSFTPALICLTMGQTTLFALLGLVLFLRFHQERPFIAGATLWLCALKPHLLLPFGAVLVAWILASRAWKVVAGLCASLAVTSMLSAIVDRSAWIDYVRLMRSPAVENDFIPCLAVALRMSLHIAPTWPQYLPAAICCLSSIWYFWRHRSSWNWLDRSNSLLLFSLFVAPYCWFYDQCLAIPAILHAAYATRSRHALVVLAFLILSTDLQLCFIKIVSPLWLWAAPAWLIWFFYARSAKAKGLLTESTGTP